MNLSIKLFWNNTIKKVTKSIFIKVQTLVNNYDNSRVDYFNMFKQKLNDLITPTHSMSSYSALRFKNIYK